MCATMVLYGQNAELGCGRYAPEGLGTGESGTRQMEMEAFYLAAGDADLYLYIGQLGGQAEDTFAAD